MLAATDDRQPSTSSSSIEFSHPCRAYEYSEILVATNNFDELLVIGRGGFGKVYKGTFVNESGAAVAAIKRLDSNSVESQFWAEVETLSKLRHCNVVSLIGYCRYGREMILVYEYMSNGTLADNLHKLGTSLSWLQRLKICIDAARGLDYLHTGTGIDVGVMHRDVSSSNILLDERWAAKISDFGFCILGPTDQPSIYVNTPVPITRGYVDLDYYNTGGLTSKSDVYTFGVVLLEVLCRKRAVDPSLDEEQCVLMTWAQHSIKKGNLKHITDYEIRDQISPKCLKQFVQVAERCLHKTQKRRPTMAEVVFSLESILSLQKKLNSSLQSAIMVNELSLPSNGEFTSISTSIEWSQPCRQFGFPEIVLATNNFDKSLVIGHGGSGDVYKGNIISGSKVAVIAIKRFNSMSSQGEKQFWTELEMFSKLHHCHLVSLFGYSIYRNEKILIYEYMPSGTLDDHLHKFGTPLSWLQRLKICIGVARGLDYLHTGTGFDVGIIHRDTKSSNILLHESLAAKICDFGLSRIGPTNHPGTDVDTPIIGTFGYLDPHYYITGHLTRKSDVYAFGVVLLEVLCRKRALDESLDKGGWNLVRYARTFIKEGNLKHIVDSGIRDQISLKCLKEFVGITERCLHDNPKDRPSMAEVVVSLESIMTLFEPADRTIFGRMVDKLSFPSKGQNSAHDDSKLSSNSKGKGKSRNDEDTVGADNKYFSISASLKVFKLADLERATRNFSQGLLLGGRTHREVFLGWVDRNTFASSTEGIGIAVAVKKFSQDLTECQTAATVLGHLDHPNIISLLGYCGDKKQKRFLVYEYMQNKNLGHFLFGGNVAKPLSWGTRLRIMIGVARGLVYIHSLKDQVIHRDVKTSNILLDQDFNAKLGGFEMAKFGPEIGKASVTTRIIGTLGYIDPVYLSNGHVNVKSDIYGFGAVLLETLTGRRAWEIQRPIYQSDSGEWESSILADISELKKIMDPRLEQNYPPEGAFQCIELALSCSAKDPKDRPSSEEVLRSLEEIYAVNE
ncbi:hypothetical protein L1887_38822 [Cichorium endivia]|nr:hypothetical protein L1887_38822 [Cichorium endivia]